MTESITDVVKFEAVAGSNTQWRFYFTVDGIRLIKSNDHELNFTGNDEDLKAVADKWRVALLSIKRFDRVTQLIVRPEDLLVSVITYKAQERLLLSQICQPLYAVLAEGLRPAYQPPLPSQRYSSANLAFMAQMDRQRARSARRPAGSSRGL